MESAYRQKQKNVELIETLWNVNDGATIVSSSESSRINRNIVECKFAKLGHIRDCFCELIETLWNVNPNQLKILSR